MFNIESFNRTILNSFHGQRCIGKQIAKKLSQRRSIKLLYERIETFNPESPALHRNMFSRRPKNLTLNCKTGSTASHITYKLARYPHVQPETLTAYKKVSHYRIKLTTYEYEADSNRKKKNCFVYSLTTKLFGKVVGIYQSSASNRVFILFEFVVTESSIRLPHAIFNCTFSSRIACEILDQCEMAIMIPYKGKCSCETTFYMAHRVNNVENR